MSFFSFQYVTTNNVTSNAECVGRKPQRDITTVTFGQIGFVKDGI